MSGDRDPPHAEDEAWVLASRLLGVGAHRVSNCAAAIDTALQLYWETRVDELADEDASVLDLALRQARRARLLANEMGTMLGPDRSVRVSLESLIDLASRRARAMGMAAFDVESAGDVPDVVVEALPMYAELLEALDRVSSGAGELPRVGLSVEGGGDDGWVLRVARPGAEPGEGVSLAVRLASQDDVAFPGA